MISSLTASKQRAIKQASIATIVGLSALMLKMISSLGSYNSKLCIVQKLPFHVLTVGWIAMLSIICLSLQMISLIFIIKSVQTVKKTAENVSRITSLWKTVAIKLILFWISHSVSVLVSLLMAVLEVTLDNEVLWVNNYFLFVVLPLCILLQNFTLFYILNYNMLVKWCKMKNQT